MKRFERSKENGKTIRETTYGNIFVAKKLQTTGSSVVVLMRIVENIIKKKTKINASMTGLGLRPQERSGTYEIIFKENEMKLYAIDVYDDDIVYEVIVTPKF